ncbi:sushi, von Willebrand factor type A, EGF and pentraxin domain-containing protein 1 isoform X2 [Exaiptasia diaphana]|uniref:HYR domain-containing protein n=1 Tax=Exaiptasia diaphana TaxID=2652724 RepID=A0A913YFW9_EXADI|nr:sushi, von Willebrand factor type A, EGF and pentraxin domain-containing protein 1 isoform X2 [Exaiptasia diaphana]
MKLVFFTALGLVFLFNGGIQGLPRDNLPPAIRCPDDMVVNSRQSSAIVCWPFPKATDESGKPSVTCSHKAGLQLQTPSTTIIKCEAKDAAGNKASCSFKIDVKDVAPPKIICPADQEISTDSRTFRINWNNPKVSDNSNMPPSIQSTLRRGSLVHVPGVYPISYRAIDASANQASCDFHIKLTVPDCKLKIPPPVNGAVACWNYQGNNVCTVSCNSNFDFAFRPATVYHCTRGKWSTFSIYGGSNSAKWPDCTVKSSGIKKMPLPQFYYTGDSKNPNVIAKIKQNSIALLSPPYSPPFFCIMNPNCNVQHIQVHAGKKSTT